ncbi:MAG: hypothetical protein JO065_06940 [Acidobacteria bacterium]|nr:hypothetical protein [Acidobacteriota bacterium]MBV9438156.1 hypothetical protein [Acidobacteriota bacterium]
MPNSLVETLAKLNSSLYEVLLPLYPSSIRLEFRDEMLSVFSEQVRSGFRRKGIAGLWRVWYSIAEELFQLALPVRFDLGWLKVPAASIVTSSALFLLFTWVTHIAVPCSK